MRKLLFALVVLAASAMADQIVTVQNLRPWPAPGAVQPECPPLALVIIYDTDPTIAEYAVILPWVDDSGAAHSDTQICPASQTSMNTACVFDVTAASVGVPVVVAKKFSRSAALLKRGN
jgi:hypothetical protein